MNILKFFGRLSPAHIFLFRIVSGSKKVGTDLGGNVYYEAQARCGYSKPRRWVMYKNNPEASVIPAEWHGWLHHQCDNIPNPLENAKSYRQSWQTPHKPNLTGTNKAYSPQIQMLSTEKRKQVSGDYEAWMPLK